MSGEPEIKAQIVRNATENASRLTFGASGLVDMLQEKNRERTTQRFLDVEKETFGGSITESALAALQEGDTWEHVLPLLRQLQTDDENQKTRIYAVALKVILEKRVPEFSRWDFIQAVKELRFGDFVFLNLLITVVRNHRKEMGKLNKTGMDDEAYRSSFSHLTGAMNCHVAGFSDSQHNSSYHGSTNRLLHCGLLTPKGDGTPPMPNQAAYDLMKLLGPTVLDVYFESNRFRAQPRMDPRNGQIQVEQPPEQGWTWEDLFGEPPTQ